MRQQGDARAMADTGSESRFEALTADIDASAFRASSNRALAWGGVVIAVIVALAVALPTLAIRTKSGQFAAEIERRVGILADGRAEVAVTWLEGVRRLGDRVVQSDLFRLFAAEVDLAGGDMAQIVTPPAPADPNQPPAPGLGAPLQLQLPYMNQVLTEFAQNAGFAAVHIIGRKGTAYLASAGSAGLTPDQQQTALKLFDGAAVAFGPVRSGAGGLVLDIYAPMYPPAQGPAEGAKPVSVALLSVPVNEQISRLLAPNPLSATGERFRLLQRAGSAWEEIAPADAPPVRPVAGDPIRIEGNRIPFTLRPSLGGAREVYAAGARAGLLDWWLLMEADAASARADLRAFIVTTAGLAVLAVLAVAAVFGAFWWRLTSGHNRELADQFRRLAARIDAQKRLLDSINNAIADYIGLKTLDGVYTYVNPAFARAVGRPTERLIGQDDAAIFGHGTAQILRLTDERARSENRAITASEKIYLQSKLHYLQISKVPFRDEHGTVAGIVSVGRDVTELVEQQERRERAVRQTVQALVRAVELRDPYLAGHSRRVAGFSVAVAKQMGAAAADIDALDIAANLSQIGKLSIRRSLLNKPERLTPDEIAEMQTHIEHAASILRGIDFGLPVLDTIYQMHERLDGTGYPRGLKGDQIARTARVLAACDVFCARIAPRSYRAAISAETALGILTDNAQRYDSRVIDALRQVVQSPVGDKLLAGIGG